MLGAIAFTIVAGAIKRTSTSTSVGGGRHLWTGAAMLDGIYVRQQARACPC